MRDEDFVYIKQRDAERADHAKKLGGKKELIRRVSVLSPEAIVEAIISFYLRADEFLTEAEATEKRLAYERLDRELKKLMEKDKGLATLSPAFHRNNERIYEIFDEMDLLNPVSDPPRAPLSNKYQRLANLQKRIAEQKGPSNER